MKRSSTISALVLAGLIASPAVVLAQADPNSADDTRDAMGRSNVDEDADNWAGLACSD